MNKTLIIGPAWVGDMVMAQTLFKLLRNHDPDLIIDVMAPAWTHALLARMPEVNQALLAPFGHGQFAFAQRYQLGRRLQGQYQQAIVLPNSWKSALVPWAAKIAKRTGWRGEWRYGLLNDVRILNKTDYPLMIERFCALGVAADQPLPELPHPQLVVDQAQVSALISEKQLQLSKPILALCPGAEYGPAKRWLPEYFAKTANEKIRQGYQVWIFGSPKDQAIAEQISNGVTGDCVNLTGKTSLAEAIDLMSVTTSVVANDSGLMHIAAALDKPLVALYGSSSPTFTPPLTKRVAILSEQLSCSPCFKRECPLQHFNCMRQLTPDKVLAALTTLEHACAR